MKKTLILIFCLCLFTRVIYAQNAWSSIATFPGTARCRGVAFTIGGNGFVGLGYTGSTYFKDFYMYSPTTNTWTKKADFGGDPRKGAVAFVLGDNAYVGLGTGGSGNLSDFWKYNKTSNTWTQLKYFPSLWGYKGATTFVIDTTAYLMVPNTDTNFYKYNASSDSWSHLTDFPKSNLEEATGFAIGSKGYICTGYDGDFYFKNLWEYNPESDNWIMKKSFPGWARSSSIGFTINKFAFVGMGADLLRTAKDFWCYIPDNDSWVKLDDYAGGYGFNLGSFVIGSNAFAGTGFMTDEFYSWYAYTSKFYKFSPAVIDVSKDTINVFAGKSTKSCNIFSNIAWNVSSNQSWLTIDKASGINYDSIKVTADSNLTSSLRQAVITISGTGATSHSILVIQAKGAGTSIQNISGEFFSMYPNPASDFITISADGQIIKAEITDLSGKEIYTQIIQNNEGLLNLTNLQSGLYLIRAYDKDGIFYTKLLSKQ